MTSTVKSIKYNVVASVYTIVARHRFVASNSSSSIQLINPTIQQFINPTIQHQSNSFFFIQSNSTTTKPTLWTHEDHLILESPQTGRRPGTAATNYTNYEYDPGYMSRKIRKFRTDKFDTFLGGNFYSSNSCEWLIPSRLHE